MWIPTTDLPVSPGHPFYARLNAILHEAGFDRFAEEQCRPFYAAVMGRTSGAITRLVPTKRLVSVFIAALKAPFVYTFFGSGGTGARPTKDGLSATAFPSGVLGTPVEVIETLAPPLFERKSLRDGSGGDGRASAAAWARRWPSGCSPTSRRPAQSSATGRPSPPRASSAASPAPPVRC